jgi:hypothetical protein
METMATLGWEIMNHPLYSTDLAVSDLHFFEPMKKHLHGRNSTLMMN